MLVKPCCLPKDLAKVYKKPINFFQTAGDVTVGKIMDAVTHLVGRSYALLCVSEVDDKLVRQLATYLRRDWFTGLVLVTSECSDEDIHRTLIEPFSDRICVVMDNHIADGMYAITNGHKYLLVQGPMLLETDGCLSHYTIYLGEDSEPFYAATEALLAKANVSALIKGTDEKLNAFLRREL